MVGIGEDSGKETEESIQQILQNLENYGQDLYNLIEKAGKAELGQSQECKQILGLK